MLYQSARDHTLELIDQYSVAGTRVEASYNNQADYLHRIPRLLDDAQMLAASAGHKIRAAMPLDTLPCETQEDRAVYAMPEDFWKLCSRGVVRTGRNGSLPVTGCRVLEGGKLAVPAGVSRTGLCAEYFRWPRLLGEAPAEDAELDNTPAVQAALPYYAAAHLVMLDNAFAYAALMNEFERRLSVAEPLEAECGAVTDAYAGEDEQ